jgi:hypothetical protein
VPEEELRSSRIGLPSESKVTRAWYGSTDGRLMTMSLSAAEPMRSGLRGPDSAAETGHVSATFAPRLMRSVGRTGEGA